MKKINKNKKILILIMFLNIFLSSITLANIKFIIDTENINLLYNNKIPISIKIISDEPVEISSLHFKIDYDNDFLKINKKPKYNNLFLCDFKENIKKYIDIKLKNKKKIILKSNEEKLLITFQLTGYKILKQNETSLNLEVLDTELLNNKKYEKKLKFQDPNIYLKNLYPSEGILNPKFSKNIFEYNLKVKHDVKNIFFLAEGVTGKEKIKINRNKLKKSSETTKIKINLSDPETKMKNQYIINVSKEQKPIKLKKNKKEINKSKLNNQLEKNNETNKKLTDEKINFPKNYKKIKLINENDIFLFYLKYLFILILSTILIYKLVLKLIFLLDSTQ